MELEVDLLEGTLQTPSGSVSVEGLEVHPGLQGPLGGILLGVHQGLQGFQEENPQGAEAELKIPQGLAVSGAGVQAPEGAVVGQVADVEGTRMRRLLTSVVENIWKLITN